MATIRARYLGQRDDLKKPRLRKEQNKKVVFDWKPEDDTSGADLRNLIDAQSAPKALLGGSLAGYDLGRGANGTPDK
jgi:ATP-dependent RNA helicase DDX23/PRP28